MYNLFVRFGIKTALFHKTSTPSYKVLFAFPSFKFTMQFAHKKPSRCKNHKKLIILSLKLCLLKKNEIKSENNLELNTKEVKKIFSKNKTKIRAVIKKWKIRVNLNLRDRRLGRNLVDDKHVDIHFSWLLFRPSENGPRLLFSVTNKSKPIEAQSLWCNSYWPVEL